MALPPAKMELDIAQWLGSADASSYLAEALKVLEAGEDALRLQSRLRKQLCSEKALAVIEQATLRRTARTKFARADQMLFTRQGLAQSSSEWIGRYKSRRLEEPYLTDVCAGIGGDLIGLAENRSRVVGVDVDANLLELARFNLAVYGITSVDWQVIAAEELRTTGLGAVHIDPDRRRHQRRTVDLQYYCPSAAIIDRLVAGARSAAVKLAPATPAPLNWQARGEREWIGENFECKQQVVWFGKAARDPGLRAATAIERSGAVHTISSESANPADERVDDFLDYVVEIHPIVKVARLQPQLASILSLAKIGDQDQYFGTRQPVEHGLVKCFRVLEIMAADSQRLRQRLRDLRAGSVDVKCRGLPAGFLPSINPKPGFGDQRLILVLILIRGSVRCAICS